MSKFLDLLKECHCSGDNKKCKCKKGSKCNGKCDCHKDASKIKEAEASPAELAGYKAGSNGSSKVCPDKWKANKNEWLAGWEEGNADKAGIKESKFEQYIKESTLEEAKSNACKQCGIKLSKISKDEGFCVECATPINESTLEEGVITDAVKQAWSYVINKVEKLGVIFHEFPEAMRLKTAGEIKKFLSSNAPTIKKLVPGIVF